jgi:8-oxo-dGTP pyrophosphatase MutT (NUDIX family)
MKHQPTDSVKPKREESYPITRGPWKTLSTQIKYANPWITVREDQVIQPDGSPGIYGVVEPRIAVGVVALTPDNEIYLVGQYRYPTERYSWELIEGGVEIGEEPLEAIKRELIEEAGLGAAKWTVLSKEIQLSNCYTSEIAHLYLAQELYPLSGTSDPTEILEVKKVQLEEAVKMVLRGEITDGLSMIGILTLNRMNDEKVL